MGIQQEQQAQQPTPQHFQQVPIPPVKKGLFSKKIAVPLWAIILTLMLVVFLAANLVSKSVSTATISNPGTAQPTGASILTPTPNSTQATTQAGTWSTVQTFTGNGVKKTALFSVPNDWRIVWSCTGQNIDGITADAVFTVLVYNSNGTLADSAVNAICKAGSTPTTDNTEEHQFGSVYLDIASTGNWTIQVQELK